MRVTVFLFFDEARLSGVAVKADGQVGDFLDDLVIVNVLVQVLQLALLKGNQLDLIENLVLEDPQMLTPLICTVQHVQVHLGNYKAVLPDALNLLIKDAYPFLLQES